MIITMKKNFLCETDQLQSEKWKQPKGLNFDLFSRRVEFIRCSFQYRGETNRQHFDKSRIEQTRSTFSSFETSRWSSGTFVERRSRR